MQKYEFLTILSGNTVGMSILKTHVTGHSQIQTKKLKPRYKARRLESSVPFPIEESLILFFFFTTSINLKRYCEIIQQFIAMLEPSESYSWFQRDNATPNTSQATVNLLKEFFDERLITRGLWPLRLPDMSPRIISCVDTSRTRFFMKKPNTIDELKVEITDLINGIPRKMLKKVFRNLQHLVKTCLEYEGGHFKHIL